MPASDLNVDLGLSVLCIVVPDRVLSSKDIADVCGCSKWTIRTIELRAIEKLRKKFKKDDFLRMQNGI